MAVLTCGKRSFSIFEDSPYQTSSKRNCCSSLDRSSPIGPSLSDNKGEGIARLRSLFVDMDMKILEQVLEASGFDIDAAIKSLNELCIESAGNSGAPKSEPDTRTQEDVGPLQEDFVSKNSCINAYNGSDWVEFLVGEMMQASNMDDARHRASKVLGLLEETIAAHVCAEAPQNLQKESMALKVQVDGLMQENSILKRAVAIQHERLKESEDRSQELQHLRLLVSQYQEKLSTLEVSNYALSIHLKHAQQSISIPGQFHPDIF